MSPASPCRKHGVSNASIYKWKAKYGGEDVSEAKRLKALEDENARLKRLLADGMIHNAALKDLLGKNGTARRRPEGIAHLRSTYEMSERRAARRVLGRCRMTMRYQTIRADDVDLCERMKAIAQERQRFGYRRLHILLWREGHEVDHKRLFRIYRKISRASGTAAAVSVSWGYAHQSLSHRRPTRNGHWTSSRIFGRPRTLSYSLPTRPASSSKQCQMRGVFALDGGPSQLIHDDVF